LGKNVVGVELNFNKEFYVPEQMESVEDILKELEELDKEMKEIGV
jgi:type I restriction enzyme M protein